MASHHAVMVLESRGRGSQGRGGLCIMDDRGYNIAWMRVARAHSAQRRYACALVLIYELLQLALG